jgi:hypothetical protein
MRHAILIAGISMLAISGSALAASPISPNSADLAAPKVQLAQVQVQGRQRNHRRRLPSSPHPARRRLLWSPHPARRRLLWSPRLAHNHLL